MNYLYIIYFIVIISANTIGAISGMGGGVLIKPILDFINADSVAAISFYSTVAVFTMAIVSTGKHIMSGYKFNWNLIFWISIGAVIGGVAGDFVFELILTHSKFDQFVQLIQIGLTIATLLFALFYSMCRFCHFQLKSFFWYSLCGLILGFLASLLAIGGGPINVSLLMLMFSLSIKDAVIYSICTIFFSQLSKLMTISLATGFERYNLTILWVIIPAAIIGGMLGAKCNNLFSPQKITITYRIVILIVLLLNLYNGYQSVMALSS